MPHFPRALLCLLLAALPAASQASTYHVSPSGSDSASCAAAQSASSSRRSINGGIACLASGDTLEIGGGTYHECISNSPQFTTTPVPAGRSLAQPTTIRAAPGQVVTLHASAPCPADREGGGVIALEGKGDTFLVVDGVNLTGNGSQPGTQRSGLTVTAQHNVFRHMHIQRFRGECVSSQSDPGDADHVWQNIFEDIITEWCDDGASPEGNPGSHGWYVNSWGNTFTRIVSRNNSCNGMQLTHEGGESRGNVVRDSLFAGNGCADLVVFPGNLIEQSIACNNAMGIDGYGLVLRHNRVFGNREANINLKGGGHVLEGNTETGSSADCPTGPATAGPSSPSLPPSRPVLPAPTNLRVRTVP